MTAAQKERLTDLLLDQIQEKNLATEWWRRNASVRHGVPFREQPQKVNVTLEEKQPPHAQTETASREPQQPQPSPTESAEPVQNPKRERRDWCLIAAIVMAIASALILGSIFTNEFLTWLSPRDSGSLYQYLEDGGYHVPETSNAIGQ